MAGMLAYFFTNYSATKNLFEDVTTTGFLSEFLLPALGGMLAYFFINYSATKNLFEDVAETGVLSEFLPSKIFTRVQFHQLQIIFSSKVIENISAGNLLK